MTLLLFVDHGLPKLFVLFFCNKVHPFELFTDKRIFDLPSEFETDFTASLNPDSISY